MSAQNVQLIQELYGLFAQRNVPAILARIAPDVSFIQSTEVPWGGTYHRHEGVVAFFTALTRHLDNRALPIERYLDAGDHVVAIGRTLGVVRASGKPFDVPVAHVWQLRDGLVISFRPFIDNPAMNACLA